MSSASSSSSSSSMTTMSSTTMVPYWRKLFPDPTTVMVYPDDFYYYDNEEDDEDGSADDNNNNNDDELRTTNNDPQQHLPGQGQEDPTTRRKNLRLNKNLTIPDLVDRHTGHFSDRRVAILLRPSSSSRSSSSETTPSTQDQDHDHTEDVYRDVLLPVGYWTQVLGLGETPYNVRLTGQVGVYAIPANHQHPNVGSLDTFWRSVENITSSTQFVWKENDNNGGGDGSGGQWCVPDPLTLKKPNQNVNNNNNNGNSSISSSSSFESYLPVNNLIDPTWGYPSTSIPPNTIDPSRGMVWAVSQAAPLRRICIEREDAVETHRDGVSASGGGPTLQLSMGPNCASGGYLSNCYVHNGYVDFGSQQQWCCTNTTVDHKAAGGAWSFVMVGCNTKATNNNNNNKSNSTSSDPSQSPNPKPKPIEWATKPNLKHPLISMEPTTQVRIEKPFLFVSNSDDDDDDGGDGDHDNETETEILYLGIPNVQYNSFGHDHRPMSKEERVPIRVAVYESTDNNIIIHNDDDDDDNNNKQEHVKVITPSTPFDEIQTAVTLKGHHLVLNPGTYRWPETLSLCPTTQRQVILGIGMATIQAPSSSSSSSLSSSSNGDDDALGGGGTGCPCLYVPSTSRGVRISGLSLEATSCGSNNNFDGSTLLQWGGDDPSATKTTKSNTTTTKTTTSPPPPPPSWQCPSGAIHDLYCFVGGRSLDRTVSVETMVKIYSSYVVGNNLWLWRADHVKLQDNEQPNRPDLSEYHVTTYGECRCDVGLSVYGDHVIMYGLAVEHTYKDMVQWYGQHGSVYFYQSELPYDIPGDAYKPKTNDETKSSKIGNKTDETTVFDGTISLAGYKVHDTADNHTAKGVGVYSYFRDYDNVRIKSGVVVPAASSDDNPFNQPVRSRGRYENVFTVWLNGYPGIQSVINDQGDPTTQTGSPCVVPFYETTGQQQLSITGWFKYHVQTLALKLFSSSRNSFEEMCSFGTE